MKKEEQFLIAVCKAYLNQTVIRIDDEINFESFYETAREHNLLAIAFCVLKNSDNKNVIPPDVYKKFEDSFYETIIRYDAQSRVILELDHVLSKNNIKHIFFKGSEIREYYPVKEARAMGDIDILIEAENRNTVKNILTDNGYQLKNSNGPVYDYIKNGVLIEMHTKIISGKIGNSDAEAYFANAFEHAEFDNCKSHLDTNYHFAYLIAHIAHHFWFYGAGIKLILDLAVMQKQFKIDYDIVFNILKAINLDHFAEIILAVCEKWFGTTDLFKADTSQTEIFIVSFGAFGNAKRNKAAVIQRKELEEGKKNNSFLTRLRLLFPSYNKIKNIPYIKFIEGRPWLLPLAWIYRLIYNLKNKKEFIKEATKSLGSDETNDLAKKEFSYFEEIGLL